MAATDDESPNRHNWLDDEPFSNRLDLEHAFVLKIGSQDLCRSPTKKWNGFEWEILARFSGGGGPSVDCYVGHKAVTVNKQSQLPQSVNVNYRIWVNNTLQANAVKYFDCIQHDTDVGMNNIVIDVNSSRIGTTGQCQIIVKVILDWVYQPSYPLYKKGYNSKQSTGMVGMQNLGATCYLNSLLQMLYHIHAFRKAVYALPHSEEVFGSSTTLALQNVFKDLQFAETEVSTKELTRAFGWTSQEAFTQQDVQEMMRILLDKLEAKMVGTTVDGVIKTLFAGSVKSYIKCVHVDYESSREEDFYDIQLDVKGCRNMHESFKKYIEKEMLEGENQYDAGPEFGKQDAQKGVAFTRFPPILTIHLKRFDFDLEKMGFVKIHDEYRFPTEINLDEYLMSSDNASAAAAASDVAGSSPSSVSLSEADRPAQLRNDYELHSVLVHSGGVGGGHYYAYIRPVSTVYGHAGDNTLDANSISFVDVKESWIRRVVGHGSADKWYKFNDEMVHLVNEYEAVDCCYGRKRVDPSDPFAYIPEGGFSSAYMLVYVRKAEASQIMLPTTAEDIPADLIARLDSEVKARNEAQRIQTRKNLLKPLYYCSDISLAAFLDYGAPDPLVSVKDLRELRVPVNCLKLHVMFLILDELGLPFEQVSFHSMNNKGVTTLPYQQWTIHDIWTQASLDEPVYVRICLDNEVSSTLAENLKSIREMERIWRDETVAALPQTYATFDKDMLSSLLGIGRENKLLSRIEEGPIKDDLQARLQHMIGDVKLALTDVLPKSNTFIAIVKVFDPFREISKSNLFDTDWARENIPPNVMNDVDTCPMKFLTSISIDLTKPWSLTLAEIDDALRGSFVHSNFDLDFDESLWYQATNECLFLWFKSFLMERVASEFENSGADDVLHHFNSERYWIDDSCVIIIDPWVEHPQIMLGLPFGPTTAKEWLRLLCNSFNFTVLPAGELEEKIVKRLWCDRVCEQSNGNGYGGGGRKKSLAMAMKGDGSSRCRPRKRGHRSPAPGCKRGKPGASALSIVQVSTIGSIGDSRDDLQELSDTEADAGSDSTDTEPAEDSDIDEFIDDEFKVETIASIPSEPNISFELKLPTIVPVKSIFGILGKMLGLSVNEFCISVSSSIQSSESPYIDCGYDYNFGKCFVSPKSRKIYCSFTITYRVLPYVNYRNTPLRILELNVVDARLRHWRREYLRMMGDFQEQGDTSPLPPTQQALPLPLPLGSSELHVDSVEKSFGNGHSLQDAIASVCVSLATAHGPCDANNNHSTAAPIWPFGQKFPVTHKELLMTTKLFVRAPLSDNIDALMTRIRAEIPIPENMRCDGQLVQDTADLIDLTCCSDESLAHLTNSPAADVMSCTLHRVNDATFPLAMLEITNDIVSDIYMHDQGIANPLYPCVCWPEREVDGHDAESCRALSVQHVPLCDIVWMRGQHPSVRSMIVSVINFTLLGSACAVCPVDSTGPFVSYVREDDDYESLSARLSVLLGDHPARHRLAVVHNKTPFFISRTSGSSSTSASGLSASASVTALSAGVTTTAGAAAGQSEEEDHMTVDTAAHTIAKDKEDKDAVRSPVKPSLWTLLSEKNPEYASLCFVEARQLLVNEELMPFPVIGIQRSATSLKKQNSGHSIKISG